MLVRLLLITAFIVSLHSAWAQPKCKIEYYSAEDGLSHDVATCVVKDREGFMWFGSWNGINRFDGHTFISYKSSAGDMSQLTNDRIDQIVEDQSNHLWLKAYDKEFYRFDKATEDFYPVSRILNKNTKKKVLFYKIIEASEGFVWVQSEGQGLYCIPQSGDSTNNIVVYNKDAAADYSLASNTIIFFYRDREHKIWIGTSEGLSCLEKSGSGIYKNIKLDKSISSGSRFTAIAEDSSHMYMSTSTGELVTYAKKERKFTQQKIIAASLNALTRSRRMDILYASTSTGDILKIRLNDGGITKLHYSTGESLHSIYEDREGTLWIEPDKRGIIRYSDGSGFRYFSKNDINTFVSNGSQYAIVEDNNGIVWINLKGGGFGYYDATKNSFEYFLDNQNGSHPKFSNIVHNIYYDDFGALWLTPDERGVIKIISQANEFKQQLLVEPGTFKPDNEIRGILYDNKERLWLGAKSGKLYVRQNDKWVTGLFVNEPTAGFGQVYCMMQDSHNNIWLGTKANGLFKATPIDKDQSKYRVTHFFPNPANPNSLASDEIYALLEDHKGRIWIGSYENGLSMIANDGDSVKFVHTGNAFQNYPKEAFRKIRHMALDGADNIWIATTDGLLLLDANDQHSPVYNYTAYRKIPGDKQSLGDNDIQFVYRDSKNKMWVATSGGGLGLAIGTDPMKELKFKNYTPKEGLPNGYVLSCVEDRNRNLWIATEYGLSKLNLETDVIRSYDSYDGLPKVGYSEAACTILPNGHIVFGAIKGYLSFDPARIGTYRIPAKIALTNLQINNEDAGPGANSEVLKENINYVNSLTLRYNENIISIDYAILDQQSSDRQEFGFRLLGFDTTWHNNGLQRRTTYTNLPPGHYVFEVKMLNSDLYANTPYRRLSITILPPWWKTWWAYLLYAIALAILIWFIRRTALTMLRLRQKIALEQKLAELKVNFFTNVSHELRTPLTLIINPIEELARKENLSEQGAAYVNVVRKNANRMVRFINQLLDLRKLENKKTTLHISNVEIVALVQSICDHFTEAAKDKRITIEVAADQHELCAWVDAEKLDVVIYNLLSNALKFTPDGKRIEVKIKKLHDGKNFSIAVCDQGPGVLPNKLDEIFKLFYASDHSAGRDVKGIGIGLALSKELVELHGGEIAATNNKEEGLTVTITMQSGKEHYKGDHISFVDLPAKVSSAEKAVEQSSLSSLAPKNQHGEQTPLVLLVEDNNELRNFLTGQLGEFYRVEVAANGKEGLEKAIALVPDLIVSDIMMPMMDGIQMLNEIKNDVNTSHIPVVLLSAKYSIESQIEGLQYGADYYITKPFNNSFLIASIDNLIRQRRKLFESLVEKKTVLELSPQESLVITSKDETFLKEVIKIVEDNMGNYDFNIESVAEGMAMSRTTFYKKFKSLTNLTPVEFVRDMRLQKAKQYLDAGENTISEVAYIVGFNNPKYFSTCFREKYNVSPSEYVKTNLKI
ncbi:hybrid sensor histidine kinase/response regulator transcription factor [Pinibacter soli]|uniref:histidine kinase n=1 Tax=Pinibacter soli TaxID=3044211 RepID=A0ABT6R9K0_9BACT|nr:two-component regulator propeller domain-containing protein [Pinibacter soli]MDI3319225.1 two-component regulator propeller domain-containing protein [Pinibacter soli]